MLKVRSKALLLAFLCGNTYGISRAGWKGHERGQPQLKMVVIVSRHGVRSPTWTQERLDSYSVLPWPQWGVPPGNLTARGAQLMKDFGSFDRAWLAAARLLPARGCKEAADTYIWADTDQRTLESGHALAEGLFPGCTVPVHSLAQGETDELFHPGTSGVTQAETDAALAELTSRAKGIVEGNEPELIEEMKRLLLGCEPTSACKAAHAPKATLPPEPTAGVRGQGDHMVDLKGPLALTSTFSEDLLLEYADGMPKEKIGWGKVDERELSQLLALHTEYFDLMHRTPVLARTEASNMLSHIVTTLEQCVLRKRVSGALGPEQSKLVVLVGHDTNLAALASLLGVHWKLDGRDDDTPPGTELRFELWKNSDDAYEVRLTVAMQTLHQLRDMPKLTIAAPPASMDLNVPGCAPANTACDWKSFQRFADAALEKRHVFLDAH